MSLRRTLKFELLPPISAIIFVRFETVHCTPTQTFELLTPISE